MVKHNDVVVSLEFVNEFILSFLLKCLIPISWFISALGSANDC